MKFVEWQLSRFCIFIIQVTLIKIMNTSLDRSAVLVLSVINLTYSSCTGICQIRLEIWLELHMARFLKNGHIRDLSEPEPESKSGTVIITSKFFSVSKDKSQTD